jgi:phosphatidylglycerophosphate synthase
MSQALAGAALEPGIVDHRRAHHSVLAAAEKRLLVAIARRLPSRVTSDLLSIVGLTSMAFAGAAFASWHHTSAGAWLVAAGLSANWFGDSLDGTVARVRSQQRPRYGFYIDHVIDLLGAVFLLAGLAVSHLMSPVIAVTLLSAFLLVSAETYLATCVSNVFTLSFAGVGPTELRLLLIAGAVKAMGDPYVDVPLVGRLLLFDVGGAVGSAGLMLAFVVSAMRQVRALHAAEPLPVWSHASAERPC